ncbi:unnamed protein product [Sphagnum troendelagicum]|uniref:C2 domain-containing protein n=1 Tax=Sphagnum troendelagicum TaxID=128251 RepID=A0ABP0UJ79_9BRYO
MYCRFYRKRLGDRSGFFRRGLQRIFVDVNNLDEIEQGSSRQDPYVVIEYGSTEFRTRTNTDGGRNPSFNHTFVVPLAKGVRELTASVWNSNSISSHDHIGSARIPLDKALSSGDDDTTWQLKSESRRNAWELRLIIHFTKDGGEDEARGQQQRSNQRGSM